METDWKKKYEEAMARMELCERTGLEKKPDYIFPELRESEDERIRKALLKLVSNDKSAGYTKFYEENGITCDDAIAYLEKQKESLHISETCKENADSFTDEDERIRKALIDGVRQIRCKNGITQEQMISYLEKRKNLFEPGIGLYYYDGEKTTYCGNYSATEDNPYDFAMRQQEKQKKQDKCPEYCVRSHCIGCSIYEKQKEQKPVEYLSKRKVYDIMNKLTELSTSDLIPTESEEYVKIHEITSDVRSLLDYPIEQKPAEKPINWTELTWKDIVELECIINKVNYEFRNGIGQESFGKEVLEQFREYKGDEYLDEIEQYSVEWSEEDEQKYQSIRAILLEDTTKKIGKRTYGDVLEWYESKGKGRFTQLKQEWSEEDEKRIKQLIYDTEFIKAHYEKRKEELGEQFNNVLIEDCDEQIAWLKSLRPDSYKNCNSRWKPSEEQMEALNALNCHGDLSYVGQQRHLISLYNDIKKL